MEWQRIIKNIKLPSEIFKREKPTGYIWYVLFEFSILVAWGKKTYLKGKQQMQAWFENMSWWNVCRWPSLVFSLYEGVFSEPTDYYINTLGGIKHRGVLFSFVLFSVTEVGLRCLAVMHTCKGETQSWVRKTGWWLLLKKTLQMQNKNTMKHVCRHQFLQCADIIGHIQYETNPWISPLS